MELGEPDASGRRRPVPIEGSETLMDIDMLITAIGQGPDVSFLEKEDAIKDLEITRWSTIEADPETLFNTRSPRRFSPTVRPDTVIAMNPLYLDEQFPELEHH